MFRTLFGLGRVKAGALPLKSEGIIYILRSLWIDTIRNIVGGLECVWGEGGGESKGNLL
jgi:hypothetical protein